MTAEHGVGLAIVLAALLLAAARARPVRRAVGGLIATDKQGRTTLVVWPATKRKKKRR